MKKEEIHIINLIRSKDQLGVSLLYDMYGGPLFGVIRRIITDESLANDVLQETFIKAWNNFDRYDESRAQLFTWLYTIARNAALDQIKKSKNNMTTDIQTALEDVSLSTGMNIDTIDMQTKLDTLSPKYRDVIYALFFKGYSQREWSEQTGIPLGTIKSRLSIGLRDLKKIFDDKILLSLIIIILYS